MQIALGVFLNLQRRKKPLRFHSGVAINLSRLANFNFPTPHCESKSNEQRPCFSKRSATPLYSALGCQSR
jgi:hypothetical protein